MKCRFSLTGEMLSSVVDELYELLLWERDVRKLTSNEIFYSPIENRETFFTAKAHHTWITAVTREAAKLDAPASLP